MQIDLSRFHETFFLESEEHAAAMESGLLALEHASDKQSILNEIFRAAHSIKGASGTFGFDEVFRFTHTLENLLDQMRAGTLFPTAERTTSLLRSVDLLRELLQAARTGSPIANGAELQRLIGLLEPAAATAEGRPKACAEPAGKVFHICFAPSRDLFRQGMDPVLVLRSLERIGVITGRELDVQSIPRLDDLDPENCHLCWTLRLETHESEEAIRDVFAFVEDGAVIEITPERKESDRPAAAAQPVAAGGASKPRESSSIRVSTDKVDRLIDLVGELVIAQSMAAQILNGFTLRQLSDLQSAFTNMERYTRELQERVMSVRMVPVGAVFSRFPRLVRDLAAATDKDILLEMSGEETELDKLVVERMSDPLTHLVRNAIDHGIETPAARRAAGKPERGTVWLRAYHQGGNVIIEVADDGRGLDLQRIREKAIERGLAGAQEAIEEGQLRMMIFHAGFSTAQSVSEISGRGVGLDVVKSEVKALGGTVAVESTPGAGMRVRIKLPLTLAILDGLLLKVGCETYVLPLIQILESIRPRQEQLSRLAGRGEVVVVRGEPVPLLRLHRLFGVATAITDPSNGLVVLVEQQGRRMALLVDELLGQQQVVIKSLETHYQKVDGVAGATILGDGQPALIVDVAGLAQLAEALSPANRAF